MTFASEAKYALAAGVVTDSILDLASDSLGNFKGAGPTEAECSRAIVDAIRRVDAWRRVATRTATEDDFEGDS